MPVAVLNGHSGAEIAVFDRNWYGMNSALSGEMQYGEFTRPRNAERVCGRQAFRIAVPLFATGTWLASLAYLLVATDKPNTFTVKNAGKDDAPIDYH